MITTIVAASLVYLLTYHNKFLYRIYTEDEKIVETASKVSIVLMFSTFPDTYKAMLRGMIKALGLQKKGVYINLSGHWFINLTSMYYFCFVKNYQLYGLWYSKLILEFYIALVYLLLIYLWDWQKTIEISAKM